MYGTLGGTMQDVATRNSVWGKVAAAHVRTQLVPSWTFQIQCLLAPKPFSLGNEDDT